jgi:outer membrane protein insertion porin family
MKDTKQKTWYNIFKASKYIEDNFIEDQDNIIAKYNELGYRDARIVRDSLYHNDDGTVGLIVGIDEGQQYFFRNISWAGNTKYSSELLSMALNIKKGDVYDLNILDNRLRNVPEAVGPCIWKMGTSFIVLLLLRWALKMTQWISRFVIAEGPQARNNKRYPHRK